MSETTSAPILLTVAQFCEKHHWARVGGLRHAIFNAKANGFDRCIVRFGRKLLLEEARVFEWLRSRGATLSATPTRAA